MKLFKGFHSIVPFFATVQQPLVKQDFLLVEAPRSHSDIPHLVGLLCTSDQLDAETSTRQRTQHSQETDIHAAGGIRTRNPGKHAAAGIGCILFRLDFSQQIFEDSSNKSFVRIRPVETELFQTDGRTDITKIIVAFRDLEKAPNNVNEV